MNNAQQQQQQMQSQQMTPLTEKDLMYMKDLMSWELAAAKKAFQYAHQTLEPECRQTLFQAAQKHQQNVQTLMQHLGEHVTQSVQATVSGAMSGAQPTTTHM